MPGIKKGNKKKRMQGEEMIKIAEELEWRIGRRMQQVSEGQVILGQRSAGGKNKIQEEGRKKKHDK